MTSAMMTIADHMASDFREAVMEAEKADMDTIDKIIKEKNLAFTEYTNRDATLSKQSEQAVRTMMEIQELRDVNFTTYERRMKALSEQLTEFKKTKTPEIMEEPFTSPNVVKLGG